jgi:hypothetical protein
MPTHFSSIGMPVKTVEDMIELINKAVKSALTISCESGHYLKWKSKTGVELWLHMDNNDKIIGLKPFYNGESNFPTGIIKRVQREDENEFEGAYYGWANPPKNEPETGYYPFVFDCVNIAANNISLPCILNIKLSAFANEIDIFVDEEEFKSCQKKEAPIAPKCFIPSGTFGNEPFELRPEALFTGIILNYKMLTNELTNKKYYWIKTETFGGIIDVVVEPELIKRKIKINGVISGVFYLYGKIIESQE